MLNYSDSPEGAEAEIQAATAEISRIDDDLVNARSHLERYEDAGNGHMAKLVESEIAELEDEFQDAARELDRVVSKWGL